MHVETPAGRQTPGMSRAELLQGFRVAGRTVLPLQGRVEGPPDLRLEPRVMDLLLYLAEVQGQVVARDTIIRIVWRNVAVSDDVISRSIYLIRKALSEGGAPPVIETIPKRGYRLVAKVMPLVQVDAATAAAPELDVIAKPPAVRSPMGEPLVGPLPESVATIVALTEAVATVVEPPRRRWSVRGRVAVTGAMILGGGLLLGGLWRPSQREGAPSEVSLLPLSGAKGLVVLPFTGDGEAAETRYLDVGQSDDVAAALSSVQDMRVIGRVSSARIQGEHASYSDIGRELGVAAVLEGRVTGNPGDLQVRMRLIDVRSGMARREMTYGWNLIATGALPDAIVNDVIADFGLSPSRIGASGVRHSVSGEAYQLFLQGRYYAQLNSAGGYEQSHDYLSQAVKVDPDFAQAWAALGIVNMLRIDFGNQALATATAEALPAVNRALELQPTLPEAQGAAGLLALYNHRFDEAADALRRATALRPSYAQAHMWLGRVFMAQMDIRRATTAFEHAHDLDPQSPIVGLNLGLALDAGGRYDEAARILREDIAYAPKFANLYWAYAHVRAELGDLAPASLSFRQAIDLGAEYSTLYAQYSILLADMGDSGAALAALTHAEALDASDPAVWAARVIEVISSGQYQPFIDKADAAAGAPNANIWPILARAKVELLRGNPRAALATYTRGHVEERLDERELDQEIDVLGGPAVILDVACAYQLTGDELRAQRLVDQAEKALGADRDRGINPNSYDYLVAAIAAMRGDESRAAALVRYAGERGWRHYAAFKVDPRFNKIRDRSKLLTLTARSPDAEGVSVARAP